MVSKAVKKKAPKGRLSVSDKIDQIVTNRILALPIFAVVMFCIYAIAMGGYAFSIGTMGTDWANDVLFGEIVPSFFDSILTSLGVSGWLYGLIMDGIVAGVGAVLGFVPQMLVLFFLLAILEDVGYMARVASSWTVSSAASACPARASSPCWWLPAAACPVSWPPGPLSRIGTGK